MIANIIVGVVIALAFVFAVFRIIKQKKCGSCPCGCGGNCSKCSND